MIPRRHTCAFSLLLGMVVLNGCSGGGDVAKPDAGVPAGDGRSPVVPISNLDACAMRLHDVFCSAFLLYYAQHQQLPSSLQEMKDLPGLDQSDVFTCPVSKKPYVYNPFGITFPQQKSLVILYDPAPSHSGMRWAISVVEPQGLEALVFKVIALPESSFTFQLPK